MSLLRLSDHAVFDTTDGDGVILDTHAGNYFHLNPVATQMLDAMLQYNVLDEVVAFLQEHIEANDEVLKEGLTALIAQLTEHHLVLE
jgi:hypothetical protein